MSKILTKRDVSLFETLNLFGILSTNQIRQIHFPKIHRKTALRRLKILSDKKWIISVTGLEKGQYVWRLSEKAAKYIGSDFLVSSLNKNMLTHDLMCNDIKIILDQFKVGETWKSSHYLKHLRTSRFAQNSEQKNNIPDWLCLIQNFSGKKVTAIELELHLKSKPRRMEVLYSYKQKEAIQRIWYVFPRERFGKTFFNGLQSFLKDSPKDWICWSIFDELKNDLPNAKVHFLNQTVRVKDLIPLSKKTADTSTVSVGKGANLNATENL